MSKQVLNKILKILDKPSVDECELDVVRGLIREELKVKPKVRKAGIIPVGLRKHVSRFAPSEGYKYGKAGWLADKEFSSSLCRFCKDALEEKPVSFWGFGLSTSTPSYEPVHLDCARFALNADYWAYKLGMICMPIGELKEAA